MSGRAAVSTSMHNTLLPSSQVQSQKGFPWGRKSALCGLAVRCIKECVFLFYTALILSSYNWPTVHICRPSCHPTACSATTHLENQAWDLHVTPCFSSFRNTGWPQSCFEANFQLCPTERLLLIWKTRFKFVHISPHCIMRIEPDQKENKGEKNESTILHVKIYPFNANLQPFALFRLFLLIQRLSRIIWKGGKHHSFGEAGLTLKKKPSIESLSDQGIVFPTAVCKSCSLPHESHPIFEHTCYWAQTRSARSTALITGEFYWQSYLPIFKCVNKHCLCAMQLIISFIEAYTDMPTNVLDCTVNTACEMSKHLQDSTQANSIICWAPTRSKALALSSGTSQPVVRGSDAV